MQCHGRDRTRPSPNTPDPNIRYRVADLAHAAAAHAAVGEARPDVVYLLASYGVGSPELEHVLPCVASDFLGTVTVD